MLKFHQKTSEPLIAETTLTLRFDQRNKSRLKAVLDDGRDAGIVLENGKHLEHNDLLISDICDEKIGVVIQIKAALEQVSTVTCKDALQLARACYHLGNRHVSVQIDADFIRYQHDHVLDDMVKGLGLAVHIEQAPFEPESGAYPTSSHHRHPH